MYLLSNFILLFILVSKLSAALYTTDSFEAFFEITENFTEKSLVILDVDRVIIEPKDAIMRYPNQRLLWELRFQHGSHLTHEQMEDLTSRVTLSECTGLLDPLSVDFINKMKEKNIPIIALTATSVEGYGQIPSIPDWRIGDLARFGIKFDGCFTEHPFIELAELYGRGSAPIFKSGILFSGGYPKGEVLEAFLDHVGFVPDKVLFVDDLLHNLVSVHTAASELGVEEVFAFQYTRSDSLTNTIDPQLAAFQLKTLFQEGIWLSDEEALAKSSS